jgi:gluconolactonase
MELHVAVTQIASGLKFPEGPIAMEDGSVILVEIAGQTLTRVKPDGKTQVIAKVGGGPNGAAVGPDGAVYITNNGGFEWHDRGGMLIPGHAPKDYAGGSIQRVDIATGKVEVLYKECDGRKLNGPNDLVFDNLGGFYFSDLGKTTPEWRHVGALYYAKADGSKIVRVLDGLVTPNGVGLSPDMRTLYYAGTLDARLWAVDLEAPGKRIPADTFLGTRLVGQKSGMAYFDSLAVQEDGAICVATIFQGGITTISSDGTQIDHTPTTDPLTTNICFGGKGLKTAFITLSASGSLISMPWAKPGQRLAYNA